MTTSPSASAAVSAVAAAALAAWPETALTRTVASNRVVAPRSSATTKTLASDATPSRVAFAGSVVATVVAAPVDRTMSVVLRPKPRAT